nr:hypothetical protein [Palleronia pontilimi]
MFGAFVVNVVLGAYAQANFVGDVGEMVILFAASISFTAAILRREADRKARGKDPKDPDEDLHITKTF